MRTRKFGTLEVNVVDCADKLENLLDPEELRMIYTEALIVAANLEGRGYTVDFVVGSLRAVTAFSKQIDKNTYGDSLATESISHFVHIGRTYWTSSGPQTCPKLAK
jgi:acetolactate synthase regulatory subunit